MAGTKTPIAIVSAAVHYADCSNLGKFWDLIQRGGDASGPIPGERWPLTPRKLIAKNKPTPADKIPHELGYYIRSNLLDELPELPIDPEIRAQCSELDQLAALTLKVGASAWANMKGPLPTKNRTGVVLGNLVLPTSGSAALAAECFGVNRATKTAPAPFHQMDAASAEMPAKLLGQALGLSSSCFTIDAACASSLYALKLASDALRSGRLDCVLAGGVCRPDSLYTQMGFAQLGALSPSGTCLPFDARASGLVVGEGAGIFALMRLEDAVAQNQRVLGVIQGIGLSNDRGGSVLAPQSEGQVRAMGQAYAAAGWTPDMVQLVECHATGTPLGDKVEVESLRQVFAGSKNECVLGSVKSNIGHTLTAAGASGLAKILMGFQNQTLAPTANFTFENPELHLSKTPFKVLTSSKEWIPTESTAPRRAALSGFGFGGINAHVLVEEWRPKTKTTVALRTITKPVTHAVLVDLQTNIGGSLQSTPRDLDQIVDDFWYQSNPQLLPSKYLTLSRPEIKPGTFRIPPKEVAKMSDQQLILLEQLQRQLESQTIDTDHNATGVFVGIAQDSAANQFVARWNLVHSEHPEQRERANQLIPALDAERTIGNLGGMVASRVAREFACGGPSFTVSDGLNSGLVALATAIDAIEAGEIDQAIVAAVDLPTQLLQALGTAATGESIVQDGCVTLLIKSSQLAQSHQTAGQIPVTSAAVWQLSSQEHNDKQIGSVSGLYSCLEQIMEPKVQQNAKQKDLNPASSDLLMEMAKTHEHCVLTEQAFQDQSQHLLSCMAKLLISRGVQRPSTIESFPLETKTPWLDYKMCQEFARGKIVNVLGDDFAEIDQHPTRVRLPDGPLLLCHRIMSVTGKPRSMTTGTLVTEHDVMEGAWYLDDQKIPMCIAVEAGQADLFLSAYLGIDFETKGQACYRLLDAVVTFHDRLPGIGDTIRYDIRIDEFFRQGSTILFRFAFVASVAGQKLMTMENGCAGFFTEAELASGRGIVKTELDLKPLPGKVQGGFAPLVEVARESYSSEQLDQLRLGNYQAIFGPEFTGLEFKNPKKLPTGMLKLVHRIVDFDPMGGRFSLGKICGEADINPDDWFLTCHFVDDMVMPGTLMYECCQHTLRVMLMRLGWVGETEELDCDPLQGRPARLKCRGQVLPSSKTVRYEVTLKEIGYAPDAYAVADALMLVDGKPIVEITNISIAHTGYTKQRVEQIWAHANANTSLAKAKTKPAYTYEQILAFSTGNPSEAFGEPYKVFDQERRIARLPRPPFQFLDRIDYVNSQPWIMKPGGSITASYDVPKDAWYFEESGVTNDMPFAVLLETALQPCGWFSAYMGSALKSEQDLKYRNLGGEAVQLNRVPPIIETLQTTVISTKVSQTGDMIIQDFDFQMSAGETLIYQGKTQFGFFTETALAQQVGLRNPMPLDVQASTPASEFPSGEGLPRPKWRMVDQITGLNVAGKVATIVGTAQVDPSAWFFDAHFYQDPVIPGSLGVEAFLQLAKMAADELVPKRDGETWALATHNQPHKWQYRGQVVPKNTLVQVRVRVERVDADSVEAAGILEVDGLPIYQLNNFRLAKHLI